MNFTQENLKTWFNYSDGHLYWKEKIGKHAQIGERAGTLVNKQYKYIQIRINKKSYMAHSLIFLYHNGYTPKFVYHINGNRIDNRIENLLGRDTSDVTITQEYLKNNFNYDNGRLIKIKGRDTSYKVDDTTKYPMIRINKKQYKQHHLIYILHYGYLPKQIDHINGDPSDNKIENLRECTEIQNAHNRRKTKMRVTSKYKGVSFYPIKNKWMAQIAVNYKKINLGYFINEENAGQAYNIAAKYYFGEFAYYNDINSFDFSYENLGKNLKMIML